MALASRFASNFRDEPPPYRWYTLRSGGCLRDEKDCFSGAALAPTVTMNSGIIRDRHRHTENLRRNGDQDHSTGYPPLFD